VLIWGDPIRVPRAADRDRLEAARVELERALRGLTERAERFWD
jgi:hypothetical protein